MHNIAIACHMWGLRSTGIMQGVVYGTRIDEMGEDENLKTRFDFDQSLLEIMFKDLTPHCDRIESRKEVLFPDIRWDGSRRESNYLQLTLSR